MDSTGTPRSSSGTDHGPVGGRSWRFDAVDVGSIRRWLDSSAGPPDVSVEVTPPRHDRERYCDTPDWRLHRAGLTLCLREHGARVEAWLEPIADHPAAGGPNSRALTQGVSSARPTMLMREPGPVRDRVAMLVGPRPLVEHAELEIVTHPCRVTRSGRTLATGRLLRVGVCSAPAGGDAVPVTFDRVELDASDPCPPEIERLVESLRERFGLRSTTASRGLASLQAIGVSVPGPAELGSITIDRGVSVGELAMVALRRQFGKMLAHEPGARLGEDPEQVHDMRVAIRRMRVAFKLFAPYLPARSLPLRDELRWAGGALGEVRDLDVQIAGVRAWGETLDATDRDALTGLLTPLESHREAARRRMLRALDSRRYERLVTRMTAVLRYGPLRSERAHRRPAVLVAPSIIEACHATVMKSAHRLGPSSSPARFHRLRIRFKTLRYALEFHRDVYGKPADDLIRAIVPWQDRLGQHQDADVATRWLHELIAVEGRRLEPRTIFVAGKMAERDARRARRLRRRFPRVAALEGKLWKRLTRQMEADRASHPGPVALEPDRRRASSGTTPSESASVIVDLRRHRG